MSTNDHLHTDRMDHGRQPTPNKCKRDSGRFGVGMRTLASLRRRAAQRTGWRASTGRVAPGG